MKDLIELLKEMGATNVVYHEVEELFSHIDESLTFEYKGRKANLFAVWDNSEAQLDGEVKQISKDNKK